MFVVGGHGYVGSRVVATAMTDGASSVEVVSRAGDERRGLPSTPWVDLASHLRQRQEPCAVVWLLDGAKHAEEVLLAELVAHAPADTHVVFVSTCTVYGDQGGDPCREDTSLRLVTPHARFKADCERMLADSGLSWCVQRLGALYGVDDRGVRADRVEKWVTQAARTGVVTVPEPQHWRGWLHRDQAARALWRAARDRVTGLYNVASANMRFGEAAEPAAAIFGARVEGDGKPVPCNYRVDASAAREKGILDEKPGEDLVSTIRAFAGLPRRGLRLVSRPRSPFRGRRWRRPGSCTDRACRRLRPGRRRSLRLARRPHRTACWPTPRCTTR